MKKHFILAAMAMTALFTACNNDDEATPLNEGTVPVTFTIGGINSRATTAPDFTTTFDDKDEIGISGKKVDPEMANVKYNVAVENSSVSITVDENETIEGFAYIGTETAVFNAYYPYVAQFNNTFSVQTNQSTGIKTSDFLTATATGDKSNANVKLEFKHRLVLVQVSLTGVTNVHSVLINGAKTTVSYLASEDGKTDPTVTTQENTVANISMYQQTENTTYWAIIPEQTIAAGNLIQVNTKDGNTYLYTTDEASSFTSGSLVKYSLTLASSGGEEEQTVLAQYSPIKILIWNDLESDDIEGGLNKYKLSHTCTINENTTIAQITNRNSLPDTESWGVYYTQDGIQTSGEIINNIVKFTGATAAQSSWYNNTLYYYAGKNIVVKPGKTYKATLKGYTDNETSGKVRIAICQKGQEDLFDEDDGSTKTDDIHYATPSGTNNTVNYWDLNNAETTKEIKFYPNTVADTSSATPTTATKTTDGDVIIAITPINNGSVYNPTFYISSIKIEETE